MVTNILERWNRHCLPMVSKSKGQKVSLPGRTDFIMTRWYGLVCLLIMVTLSFGTGGCASSRPLQQTEPEVKPPVEPSPIPVIPSTPENASIPGLVITPVSPGVFGQEELAKRDPLIRAVVEVKSGDKLACLRMEVDGDLVTPEVYQWDSTNGTERLVVWYQSSPLPDGVHTAKLSATTTKGDRVSKEWSFSVKSADPPLVKDPISVTLYFADNPLVICGIEGPYPCYLTPVSRDIPRTSSVALAAVEELIKGPLPHEGELSRTVPAQAGVKSVNIRDGICYVDFTNEFALYHPGGTTGGAITLGSLVWTLTELPSIEKVVIWVEGELWQEGHFDLTEPLGRGASLEMTMLDIPVCRND